LLLTARSFSTASTGERLSAFSLIDEAHGRRVRMGHLAFLGSHKVNGVSKLHSDLMKVTVFRELDFVLPGRITNKTNGITFRRWLKEANPGLTMLLTEVVGDRILDDAMALENATPVARCNFTGGGTPHRRLLEKL
jgi:starch phosphorylase